MIPITQTKFYPDGNCMDACIASILECPLESLPNYHGIDWFEVYNSWLADRGLKIDFRSPDESPPSGYHMASVCSPRGPWLHSVVILDGELVHDPSPDRHMGIGEIVRWDVLVALETVDK